MLCRECGALVDRHETKGETRRGRTTPPRGRRVHQDAATRCRVCGRPLDDDGTGTFAQRLRQKLSQLAQFGLAGLTRPLLKGPDRDDS